jgi:hypothetical protein
MKRLFVQQCQNWDVKKAVGEMPHRTLSVAEIAGHLEERTDQ